MSFTKGNSGRKMAALLCAMMALSPVTGAQAATIEYTVTASKVNIRKEANTSSGVLTVLTQGSTLSLISATSDGWLKVNTSAGAGYVSAEYACLTSLSGADATATVLADKLNIRSGASASSKVLTVARKGSKLSVLALTDGWLKVSYDGEVGYVSPAFVVLDAGSSSSAGSVVSPQPTQTPSTDSSVLTAILKKGSKGAAVQSLQEKLIVLGYLTGIADGVYGNATVAAVKAFQKDQGIASDGIAGASTQAALSAAAAPSAPSQPETPDTNTETTTILQKGDKSDAVRAMQEKLIALGYLTGKADGIFGNDTQAAVKAFQKDQGITSDGIAGASTLAALSAAVTPSTPSQPETPDTNTETATILQKGDKGEAVRALQEKLIALGYLSGTADGKFGYDTRDAVKAFQRNSNLDADGIAGPTTLAALASITVTAPSNPVAPETNTPVTTTLLKKGAAGEAVRALQEKLIALGYLTGTADGKYGDDTVAAVKAFQKDSGLTVDGIAGTLTLDRLSTASGSTGNSNPTGVTLLKYGDTGEAVSLLQSRLKELGYFSGSVGGNFGAITRDAVKSFQTAAGLTADGIAGEETLTALYSSDAPKKEDVTLRVGDTGEAVKKMQARLKELGYLSGNADGSFGSVTQAAVMAFQTAAGITSDGIAGLSTLNALYSDSAPTAPAAPSKPGTSDTPNDSVSAIADKIVETAKKYLGCAYVYAEESPPYFDCSGLTYYVYKQYGYTLLRTAYQQGYNSQYQKLTYSELKKGDLVFFNTNSTDSDMCDHVGIYMGNGQFIHASSSAMKVIISDLTTGYYNRVFSWGRRILG